MKDTFATVYCRNCIKDQPREQLPTVNSDKTHERIFGKDKTSTVCQRVQQLVRDAEAQDTFKTVLGVDRSKKHITAH